MLDYGYPPEEEFLANDLYEVYFIIVVIAILVFAVIT